MSLFYPPAERGHRGKTTAHEDRFSVRFVELSPPERIVQVVTFESPNPAFAGEMTMVITLEEHEDTEVTMLFEDIPPGIRPEDNEAGTRSSLEKLARCVESGG